MRTLSLVGCGVAVFIAGAAGVGVGATLTRDAHGSDDVAVQVPYEEIERCVAAAIARANSDLRQASRVRRAPDPVAAEPRAPLPRTASAEDSDGLRSADAAPLTPVAVQDAQPKIERVRAQSGRLEQILAWHEDASLRRQWVLRSRAETAEWFGLPDTVGVASNGVEMWTYDLGAGANGDPRRVTLRFSQTGFMDVDN